ncbi:hypothetical protein [Streptomyces monashensis]|uniref:hypothetical protein n=1 Tax=Streptomyces monashensis TaxID=1678012 RepID=UPI0015A664F3|nr:hypothetical protein [Streptomyces monashensis]
MSWYERGSTPAVSSGVHTAAAISGTLGFFALGRATVCALYESREKRHFNWLPSA